MSRILNMFRESRKVYCGRCPASLCSGLILVTCLSLVCFIQPLSAGITWSGDVSPDDPHPDYPNGPYDWTSSTSAIIANVTAGSLSLTNGPNGTVETIATSYVYVGNNSGATGTASITGSKADWTNENIFHVGYSGVGTLNVNYGGYLHNKGAFYIGENSTSTGTVNVRYSESDIASLLDVDGSLYVGQNGSGEMNVTNGGMVTSGNGYIYTSLGDSEVTVDGVGSEWDMSSNNLHIGDANQSSSTCTLEITDGGKVYNAYGYVGHTGLATTEVVVDSYYYDGIIFVRSEWGNSSDLYIGYNGGEATLAISDYGLVYSDNAYIGHNEAGTVTVTGGAGYCSFYNYENLTVGSNDEGTLSVSSSAAVYSESGTIGDAADSTGEVTVTGTDSIWSNDGELVVGNSGDGTLTVAAGGEVSNTDGTIGDVADSTGEVTVTGEDSVWSNDGELVVGNSGDGTLTIAAGGVVVNTDGCIGAVAGTGEVTVTGTDSIWLNDGGLVVGDNDTGTLTILNDGYVIVGSTQLAGGVLTIDDDDDDDSFINIGSGGKLSLYSTSSVTTLSGFINLISGTNDAICYWDGDSWELLTSGATGYYTVSYDAVNDYATLAATYKLLGDANGDGVVSAGDYASVQANFGHTGDPGIPGDANWDGIVSAGDYASIQANFGHTLP